LIDGVVPPLAAQLLAQVTHRGGSLIADLASCNGLIHIGHGFQVLANTQPVGG